MRLSTNRKSYVAVILTVVVKPKNHSRSQAVRAGHVTRGDNNMPETVQDREIITVRSLTRSDILLSNIAISDDLEQPNIMQTFQALASPAMDTGARAPSTSNDLFF